MNKKLTLTIEQSVIEKAKKYAHDRQRSLSGLIENYLKVLTIEEDDDFEISSFIKSISTGNKIPTHLDDKEAKREYIDFLDKKYQ